MKSRTPNRKWLVLIGVLLQAPLALAQLQVGDNTTLRANAVASLGWTDTRDGNDLNSLTYGFNGSSTATTTMSAF